MTVYIAQYEAVKAHATRHYPDADCISYGRRSDRIIYADVEGTDLHLDVFYWMKGGTIDGWWSVVRKRECTTYCLHQTEVSKRLYQIRHRAEAAAHVKA